MGKAMISDEYLTDIADAIRAKKGTSDTYTAAEMGDAVRSIPTGEPPVLVSKSVTSNGTYNASSDNADGYDNVAVNVANSYSAGDEGKVVNNGALASQTSRNVTDNGTYDTTSNNEVVVNVQGGGGGSTKYLHRLQCNFMWNFENTTNYGYFNIDVVLNDNDMSYIDVMNNVSFEAAKTPRDLFNYFETKGYVLPNGTNSGILATGYFTDMLGEDPVARVICEVKIQKSNNAITNVYLFNTGNIVNISNFYFNSMDSSIEGYCIAL